ncbi:hypothetical protein STAL104432_30105 [Streptomyces albus]
MLAGQAADHGEPEPGAGEGGQVALFAGDGLLGAAQRQLAHHQTAVLDGDDDAGRDLLDVDVHLGGGRREVRRVVHQFGQCVHDALGGVPGDGGLARRVQPDPLVAADTAHGAAQDRLHDDRLGPAAARTGTGEHGDGVGDAACLRRPVVQVQQVGQHVLVGVPVLHLPQVGGHAGGQGLHAAGRVGAGGECRGPHALALVHLARQGDQDPALHLVRHRGGLGQRGLRGAAVAQPVDDVGYDHVGEVGVGRVPFRVPCPAVRQRGAQPAAGQHGAGGHGDRRAQHHTRRATAPGDGGTGRGAGGVDGAQPRDGDDRGADQQGEGGTGGGPASRNRPRRARGRLRWYLGGGHQSGPRGTEPGRGES